MPAIQLISPDDMIAVTDAIGQIRTALESAVDTSDDWASQILTTILGITDPNSFYVGQDLRLPAWDLKELFTSDAVTRMLLQGFIAALNQHCSQRGLVVSSNIRDINSFATFFNAAGNFYDVLYSPAFAAAYAAVFSPTLSAANCYSPEIKQSGQGVAMGKWDYNGGNPVFTDGAAVDAAYLGAVPKLKVTSQITKAGQDDIVVTVTGVDHTGASGTHWTYTASSDIAPGNYDFAEADQKWIRNVAASNGIAVEGASSGICYVEGWEPR